MNPVTVTSTLRLLGFDGFAVEDDDLGARVTGMNPSRTEDAFYQLRDMGYKADLLDHTTIRVRY